MDQEVLQDLYNRAVSKGYSKSIQEFSTLISSDQEVLEDNYNYVKQQGYQKPIEDFQVLVGVKKKEDTVLPSEDGLLVQPTTTQPAKEVSVVDDTTTAPTEPLAQTLEIEKPLTEGAIRAELIGRTEEYVVPEMNYKYADQGFVFEETGLGDAMTVTAANGQSINVDLDVFFDANKKQEAKKLNEFIQTNRAESKRLKSMEQGYEADKVKFDSQKQIDTAISQLNTQADDFNKKIQDYLKEKAKLDEERAAIEALTDDQKITQSAYIKEYNERYKELNKTLQSLAKEEEGFTARQKKLNSAIGEYNSMRVEQGTWLGGIWNAINVGASRISSGMSAYAIETYVLSDEFARMKPDSYRQEFARIAREKGLEVPENINKMSQEELKSYYSDIAKVENIKLFPGTALMVGKEGETTTKDVTFGELIENQIISDRIKEQKQSMLPDIRKGLVTLIGDKDTTEQWALAKKEGFWGGAILGLAESIPAMLAGFGGNWAKATADMMMLTSDFLDEEMSGPEFEGVLEQEKIAFKVPVAIASAVLETYGLRNVVENTGLRNSILLKILRKPKKDLTGVPFGQLVKNEVDNMLTRGLLRITGAGLAEFETGAAQQAVEITAKEVFNGIKEKELFKTPESVAQGLGEILYSGAQEAVGGFIMGIPSAVSSAMSSKDFTTIDNGLYEMFRAIRNDTEYRKGFVLDIKEKINRGEITKEEGQRQLNNYETAVALSNEIPTDATVEQEKALMGQLLRKKELLQEIEGKDPTLVEKQKEELSQIDETMRTILKTKVETKVKEEGKVDEEVAPELKTKQEKKQSLEIKEFFGEQVAETTETVTDNLSINRSEKVVEKPAAVLNNEKMLTKIAQRGAKAVAKILPNTKIILHETKEEFEKFASPGRGEYDPTNNVIHINLENALITTVPHEIFHAVFLNKVKTDPAAAKLAETMMKSVRKTLPATSELAKRIDTFAESYTDVAELQNEERLAELIGILSSEYKTLSKPNKNKVVKFIENLARRLGIDLKISEFTKTDEDVIDLLNTLAGKVATGEELVETDVQTLEELDNGTNPIGSPTEIRVPTPRQQIDFKESYPLSLVTPDKSVDLISLIQEIKSKKQKVWFWVADQLGSGIYNGITLDAGPSFPFADIKVNEDAIWATGISEADIQNKLKQADYIFIISGSPQQSKLFNKQVYDVFTQKLGDYGTFKEQALETKPTKALREVLEAHDSWESLREDSSVDRAANAKKGIKGKIGTGRKKFLQALISTEKTKTTAFHKLIQSLGGYVNVEELRDGFYKENDFKQNDIMLVLKPTGYSLESNHSTYDKEILGEVVGVPDVKVDAFDVMPQEIADRYAGKPRTELSQAIAPFGSGVREVTPERLKRQQLIQDREGGEFFTFKGQEYVIQKTTPSDTSAFDVIIDNELETQNIPNKNLKSFQNPLAVDKEVFSKADITKPIIIGDTGTQYFVLDGNQRLTKAMLDGKDIEAYVLTAEQTESVKSSKQRAPRQQRATEEYISEGRDAGFKDTVIIDYLSRVRKVPMKEIKEAMEIVSEGLGALPESFKNIQGGARAGLKLFKRIDALVQKENKKKTPLAQSQILEKAIEYMQNQPEYKNEADTYKVRGEVKARKGLSTQQMLMELDLQKTLGLRPSQDMAGKLRIARAAVKQRIKGIRDVQKIKTELKNFMRKALPARILLSKDAQRMFRYIERVTPDFMQSTQAQGAKIDNVFKEITDFVAEENNKILTKEIQSILEGKYERTERAKKIGKTIDPQTRKRIDGIRKMTNFSGLTPEQINELQAKLTEEFNNLLNETNPTDEQLNRMGDLQIAINYANAEVMENTNPRKTQVLDSVYAGLNSIIELGKQQLKEELEAAAKRYRAETAAVYEEITGEKLDPDDPDFKKKLAKLRKTKRSEEQRKKLDSKLKKFFRGLRDSLRLSTAESLSGLMDRISSLPGEMMGGKAQELVTDKINNSSIQYKRRMLAFDVMLQDKLKEYYGKDWAKKARKFKKDIFIVEDSEGVEHYYTQDQMAYLYNQYKNTETHPAFKNMYGDGYAETMQKIEDLLDSNLKKFADWQVDEYFPAVYDYYNSVYKRIYRTDMPQTQNYAGRIFRTEGEPEAVDLLADRSTFNTSVTSPSILLRTNPATEILAMNLTDALVSYTRDMEYFAAYAESIRDVNKIFTNPFIEEAIRRIHGNTTYDAIDNVFKSIAAKGPQRSKGDALLNKLNSYFITARIGLSPVIAIKQLTSMFTYANDIGIVNWVKYSMKNLPEVVKTWKEIRDNSVYMQDRRNDSILRQIETYANLDKPNKVQWLPSKSKIFYENFIMFTTKFGDRTAIMLGGMPNYLYYKDTYKKKNPGASEQEVIDYAIKRFEKDTKETQQSSDLQDKDYFQTSNPWVRSMNMFLTTPKQYLRKEITASRNLMRKLRAWDRSAGKGTLTENVRQLLMYHFFMPMFFQWVSAGFPISDWDDEDTEDMLRAAIIGNFNALFIVGELIAKTADAFQQKPWYKDFRQLAIYQQAIEMLGSLQKFVFGKNEKERSEGLYQFALDAATTRGVPVATLEKFAYNYPKLSQSEDFGEFMLRLLNYSKYQIEGRPKKQGAKKKPMSMTEMKKFYPEMYEMIKDMEDPELKQLEKDIREMEKEMLQSLYE